MRITIENLTIDYPPGVAEGSKSSLPSCWSTDQVINPGLITVQCHLWLTADMLMRRLQLVYSLRQYTIYLSGSSISHASRLRFEGPTTADTNIDMEWAKAHLKLYCNYTQHYKQSNIHLYPSTLMQHQLPHNAAFTVLVNVHQKEGILHNTCKKK